MRSVSHLVPNLRGPSFLPAVLAILLGCPLVAYGQVSSDNVTHLGEFPVTDFDPWVGDVAGYVDGMGREFALLACGDHLRVLDCTDPANIVQASRIDSPAGSNDLKDVRSWSHYAYACHEFGPILIVDLSDPYNAQQVGTIPQGNLCYPIPCTFELDGGCHNLFVDDQGRLLVTGLHWAGIQIYDLAANPTNPPLIGEYGPAADPGYYHDAYAANGILYGARPGAGNEFEIVEMNPPNFTRLDSFGYTELGLAHSCWATEDEQYLVTCDESSGGHLFIWDISDPTNALPLSEYESGSGRSIHNVQLIGRTAYISYYNEGLRIVDFSDPFNPVEVGHYNDLAWDNGSCSGSNLYRGLWGIYALQPSGNLYVSEMCGGGLHVLRFDAVTAAPDPMSITDRIDVTVMPNPAAGPVQIRAALASDAPVDVQIYDAAGRLVRNLASAEVAGPSPSWSWDGRDDARRKLSAGVYYARIAQGVRAQSHKIVLAE